MKSHCCRKLWRLAEALSLVPRRRMACSARTLLLRSLPSRARSSKVASGAVSQRVYDSAEASS